MPASNTATPRLIALSLLASTAFASAALTNACSREPRHKTASQRGHWLYTTRCAHCHGAYGLGDGRRLPGPKQPRNLTDPKVYEQLDNAAIKRVIRNGKGEMPGFGQWMKDKELDELIAYLHTLPAQEKARRK